MRAEDLTIFFVVQKGSLSLRARFLALSIRKFVGDKVKVVAAFPEGKGLPDDETLALFKHLDVEAKSFFPDIWNRHSYAIGNKLDAACLPFKTRHVLFLDTDTIFLNKVDLGRLGGDIVDVAAARMMGIQTFRGESAAAYEKFAFDNIPGLECPASPRVNQDGERLVSFPMFNSGVVLFRADKGLGESWRAETIKVLESSLPQDIKFPYADQASLSLLMAGGGITHSGLPIGWNLPPTTRKQVTLLHYFRFPAALEKNESRWVIARLHKEAAIDGFNALGELTLKDISHFKAR